MATARKPTHWRRLVDKGYTVANNVQGKQLHYSEKGAKAEAKKLRESRKGLRGVYLAQAVYVSSLGMEPYWLVMYRMKYRGKS